MNIFVLRGNTIKMFTVQFLKRKESLVCLGLIPLQGLNPAETSLYIRQAEVCRDRKIGKQNGRNPKDMMAEEKVHGKQMTEKKICRGKGILR